MLLYCAPEGIRTPNLLIRSQMLYPLSYGRMITAWATSKSIPAAGARCEIGEAMASVTALMP